MTEPGWEGFGVGLLMPSFGSQATSRRILDTARKAEGYGFHSLWVRDHLFIPPGRIHGGVAETGFHLEALHVLGAVAAVTKRIKLGTAILIPLRHPVQLAQELATLSFLGGDRLILGVGAGAFAEEFTAVGRDWDGRQQMVKESVEVVRLLAKGSVASYRGEFYAFDDVAIIPPPPPLPIWYGGSGTLASVRTAVERGYEGWIGLAPAAVFDGRLARLRQVSAAAGRRLTVASIPPTSVARTRAAALAPLDQDKIVASVRHGGGRLPYESFDEVKSALIVGTPEEAVEQLAALAAKGVDVIILDLRLVGDAFDDVFQMLGEEVLPQLRLGNRIGDRN